MSALACPRCGDELWITGAHDGHAVRRYVCLARGCRLPICDAEQLAVEIENANERRGEAVEGRLWANVDVSQVVHGPAGD